MKGKADENPKVKLLNYDCFTGENVNKNGVAFFVFYIQKKNNFQRKYKIF